MHMCNAWPSYPTTFRFLGLASVYYSLQYLSLADVTVLGFLAPMCTAMTGSFFLKESFGLKEGLASCKTAFLLKLCNSLIESNSVQSSRCGAHRTT